MCCNPQKQGYKSLIVQVFIAFSSYIERGGGGHGGRVVTLSPPTSQVGVQFTALPQVGKLVVA